jgi:site-specific DNA-methyltransferase (adenine-specific)
MKNIENILLNNIKNKYSSENLVIILGDSIKILKNIKSDSIDLIFADPPYNIGKDFGNNIDKWEDTNAYIDWCKIWINECMRILKDIGTMYFMTATQYMPYLDIFCIENYNVINRIIWEYDSSGVQTKKSFGSLYEPILMINKSKKYNYTFNYKDVLIKTKTGERQLIDYRKTPPVPYNLNKIPGNVWNFPRVRYKMNEYENHPTQKPEILLERIIKVSSNENDIILDPFAGSFTTISVANKLNRKAIGIEMNEEYYKIGLRRCNLTNLYNSELLVKSKIRKTTNKSKKDHNIIT